MQAVPQSTAPERNILGPDASPPSMPPLTSDGGAEETQDPVNTAECGSSAFAANGHRYGHTADFNGEKGMSSTQVVLRREDLSVVEPPVQGSHRAPEVISAETPTASAAYFGILPPEDGAPAYMTFLRAMPKGAALDEIERYGTLEMQAQGLLQDNRFLQCARGKKLVKKLASTESPARAHLLEIQHKWDAENVAKKKAAADKKVWLANTTATR